MSQSVIDKLADPNEWTRVPYTTTYALQFSFESSYVLPDAKPWEVIQELILKTKDLPPSTIFPPDIDDVCRRAMKVFGQKAQESMLIGEIGELLTLFGRRAQNRDLPEQWIDEIVDVLFMAMQMAHLRGIDAINKRMAEKIEKIKARLAPYIECERCHATGIYRDLAGWRDETCVRCNGTGHIKAFVSAVEAPTPPKPTET